MSDAIQAALKWAIVTGDIDSAIKENEHNLTNADVEVLQNISPQDLQALIALESSARATKGMVSLPALNKQDLVSSVWVGGIW